jgi:exopolysaccharide production protein ExoY
MTGWSHAGPPQDTMPRLQSFVFRTLDVVIAGTALTFLFPLMLVIFFSVRVSDGASSIFRQRRVGVGGSYFWCLKFRSMVIDADFQLAQLLESDSEALAEWTRDQKLKRDPRITPFGRFLRKSSLDELPQLLNVIRGDMSIIGPRPIVPNEVERYGRYFVDYMKAAATTSAIVAVSR